MEERCKLEMEGHKQLLDKEYESLLQQFSKELEKLQVRHQQELDRKVKQTHLHIYCMKVNKVLFLPFKNYIRLKLEIN